MAVGALRSTGHSGWLSIASSAQTDSSISAIFAIVSTPNQLGPPGPFQRRRACFSLTQSI